MQAKFKPRSNRAISSRLNRDRVILSLYMHTPRFDFIAQATNKDLMAEAGIGKGALQSVLMKLKDAGEIVVNGWGKDGNHFILMSHPDGPSYYEFRRVHDRRPEQWTRDWKERDGLTQEQRDQRILDYERMIYEKDLASRGISLEYMQEYDRRCAELIKRKDETYEEFEIRTGQRDRPSSANR